MKTQHIRLTKKGRFDFDKVVFYKPKGSVDRTIVKYNGEFHIDRKQMTVFVSNMFGAARADRVERLALVADQFSVNCHRFYHYELWGIGINYDTRDNRKVYGHIEIKYRYQRQQVVFNIHIKDDASKHQHSLSLYTSQFMGIFSHFLSQNKRKLVEMERLSHNNYRSYAYHLAYGSQHIYARLKDFSFDKHGNKRGYVGQHTFVDRQKMLYQGAEDSCLTYAYSFYDDYHPDPKIDFSIVWIKSNAYFSNGHCMHLDFTAFKNLFEPEHYSIEADTFDGGGPGYVDEEIPVVVERVNFSYADLRDLNFKETRFINVNFTGSDLRGCKFNFKCMDRETLLSLGEAQLLPQERERLNCYMGSRAIISNGAGFFNLTMAKQDVNTHPQPSTTIAPTAPK